MASGNTLKQSNIGSFFNRSGNKSEHLVPRSPRTYRAGVSTSTSTAHLCDVFSSPPTQVSVTYHRRTPKPAINSGDETDVETRILSEDVIAKDVNTTKDASNQETTESRLAAAQSKPTVVSETSRKQVYLDKKPGQKRVLGQYFLELGQADFILSNCTVCGLKYSRGDDEDEKVHKSFHRRHLQGVQFKGWQNERIVNMFDGDDRIILVLTSDPSHHQHKVHEIVAIMEKEMGLTNEWLLHRFCKFGNAEFERKAVEKTHLSRDSSSDENDPPRVIVCSEIPEPAVCGVRGIWVPRPERRKGIGTKLLDIMRKTFSLGYVLEPCQCAFSQPTSDGKAFAANYCKTDSFLIYKSSIHGN